METIVHVTYCIFVALIFTAIAAYKKGKEDGEQKIIEEIEQQSLNQKRKEKQIELINFFIENDKGYEECWQNSLNKEQNQ